ncbi:hypothetical protein P153DRAFT_292215 [Dothidotthia symphoricarpi CBS 119687]|uniref:Cyclin-domain-containing protein n=1 Tax=Dothidotthia symphoricarpi CBS 119687 TaxID=1392245 RepID=A0A6A6ADS1_9PLEO|nr:uncharacterized protein P153DRAFT_292215 [Dothidotthia symphoricarpi CBS 119687]KAF2129037.1 hypothetical protein P153DRAFT_292215 [Dothidotthia symphoricarpi CBS 119687]
MLASSSPTISAPGSPSTTFHAPARVYHASSRRTSTSSGAPSPRFVVSSANARRFESPHLSKPAIAAPSPVPAYSRSPQSSRRGYVDAGTQYSPAGLPPTYHPPSQPNLADTDSARAESAPLAAPAVVERPRGPASPAPPTTDPPEPTVRVDPQPATPAQHAQPPSRRMSSESTREDQHDAPQKQQPAASDVTDSPAKRARPHEPNVKIMPLKYETCNVKDLGVLVSDMLMELVRLNDGYPLRDGQLTRFHSRAPPGISVRDYLVRLIVHATLSPPILLSMVFYVDKLCTMYPAFTISSLTVHRFLITAATVAAKGLSDSFWTNSLYARVGGVSPEVLVDYYKGLVERGSGYVMETGPELPSTPSREQVQSPTGSATGIHTSLSST